MRKVFFAEAFAGRKARGLLLCLALLPMLCSCEHKELCMEHSHMVTLRLEFDWRDAPGADPAGMAVFFYPLDGEEVPARRFDFAGSTGGTVEIAAGNYRVITYNNDTEAVLFSGTGGFDTHTGLTRDGNVLEPIYGSSAGAAAPAPNGERVVICPDMMYGCAATDVEVTAQGVGYHCVPFDERNAGIAGTTYSEEHVITLYPHELVCTYTYEIRDVSNLGHVTAMCATLSGMAPSIAFGDESLGTECVTLPFGAAADADGTTIVGGFLTFGHNEGNSEPHRMSLYVVMDDGAKYLYGTESERFDVTAQVHSAPDRRRVHLVIEGLDLPASVDDGGFDGSADDWREVDGEIPL